MLGAGRGAGRLQSAAEGSAAQGRPGLRHPRLESARPSPQEPEQSLESVRHATRGSPSHSK